MMLSVLMFPGRLDADLVLNKEIWVGWIEGEQPSSGIGSSPYGVWNAAGGSGQTAQQSDVKSKRKARVFRWGSSDLPSYDSSAKKKMEKKYNKELERKREKSKEDRLRKKRIDWKGKSETTSTREPSIQSETRNLKDPGSTLSKKPRMFRWIKEDAKYSRQPSSPTENQTKLKREKIRDQKRQLSPLGKGKKNQDKPVDRAKDRMREKPEFEKIKRREISRRKKEASGFSRPKVRNRNEGIEAAPRVWREKTRMLRRGGE